MSSRVGGRRPSWVVQLERSCTRLKRGAPTRAPLSGTSIESGVTAAAHRSLWHTLSHRRIACSLGEMCVTARLILNRRQPEPGCALAAQPHSSSPTGCAAAVTWCRRRERAERNAACATRRRWRGSRPGTRTQPRMHACGSAPQRSHALPPQPKTHAHAHTHTHGTHTATRARTTARGLAKAAPTTSIAAGSMELGGAASSG